MTKIPIVLLMFGLVACTHRVEVAAKDPITVNLNVKVEHEIRVKLDRELDELFEDEALF